MPKLINEETVFKAVIALLVERGYERTTTSDMAAAARIHEATLFRKYGSKVGLIERAINHQLSITPLSRVTYSGDLQADLLAILDAYIEIAAEYGEVMPLLLIEIPRHAELQDTMQAAMANIQRIMQIVARYQEQGMLQPEPPLTTVNALLAPIMVQAMYQRAHADLAASTIDPQTHVARFLKGRCSSAND